MSEPVLLTRRLSPAAAGPGPVLVLPLDADARTRLRGLRRSACGRDLLLQLPRGEALVPGELLSDAGGTLQVRVEAAPEPLLLVRAAEPLELLRAAYHLGNRHVALELRPGELRLLQDPVLADLLVHRGLVVEHRQEPFLPEGGAYATGHSHSHSHSHDPSHGDRHLHSHGDGQLHHHGHHHDHGDRRGHNNGSSPDSGSGSNHGSSPSQGPGDAARHAPDVDLPHPPGSGPDPGPGHPEARSQPAGVPR
ncbi:MAG: urease accessory protein UreE [Cyanobacteriota bacterium]|nr:urease accessory protein UreE [Cyanobacteriota bacterium]